ncbi:unnamed protein product [Mesocestoides corti]|uniref:Uncharacterized protein n=1 Tax=Mesocestoides corti TaxID=53468 RepID=A0A0R3UCP0_MESCO|nr:unnamed protein product [Mesocestoides corti]
MLGAGSATDWESVGPPPEFIPQSIRRLRRRPRSQLPATSEGNSGKEEEADGTLDVTDGDWEAVDYLRWSLSDAIAVGYGKTDGFLLGGRFAVDRDLWNLRVWANGADRYGLENPIA